MVMDERNWSRIEKHLQDEAAQKRIRQNIQRGRNEATVTIGKAARLFGFSESQLRDWEKMGLIRPLRPREGGEGKSVVHRQYSFTELDKLAIIRELIQEAKINPGSIPQNVDEIWNELAGDRRGRVLVGEEEEEDRQEQEIFVPMQRGIPIEQRVLKAYNEQLFWRFYASRVLWLGLLLIYEDMPGYYAGLILPSRTKEEDGETIDPASLPEYGTSLVGWLGQTSSFYTFLTDEPFFEIPSDYVVVPLCPRHLRSILPDSVANRTLVVVPRRQTQRLRLSEKAVRTVQRLLEPLYEVDWRQYFGVGMNELVHAGMDFKSKLPDAVLTGLMDMVMQLGGKNVEGTDRWQFCYALLPDNPQLPMHRQNLIVRAKSEYGPQKLGVTVTTPDLSSTSVSQRAYQSGRITYRPQLSLTDTTPLLLELEGPVCSNIAVPIGGETGQALGVLYVASYERDAFTEDDQRVLRIVGRMIEELLSTYTIRQQATKKMLNLLEYPAIVDPTFKEFPSENEFFQDVEELLLRIKMQMEGGQEGRGSEPLVREISFIAVDIDIDVQERIANSYGDQILHSLNKTIGIRIRDLLPTILINRLNCKLYHIYGGRYFLFLQDNSLEKTKSDAEELRKALEGSIAIKQSNQSSRPLMLPEISVHVGVTWYSYEKLRKMLRNTPSKSITNTSATLYHSIDVGLESCIDNGGNVVFAWDPGVDKFRPYQPEDQKR